MSKGSDFDFLGLYSAILKDIALYFPNDQREWDRDLSRITTLSLIRGESIFLIDLPAIGKRFDASLSAGRLDVSGLPLAGRINTRSVIPRLFRGLWLRVFDHSGCLRADIDPNVVLFLRTLLYVGKNFNMECSPKFRFKETEEFYNVDATLPPPSEKFDSDGSYLGDLRHLHLRDMVSIAENEPLFPSKGSEFVRVLDSVQRIADRISGVFSGFDPGLLHFKHGPGAVSDNPRGGYKYNFPNWAPRLEYYFPYDISATTSLEIGEVDPALGFGFDSYEPHSVLIAVPKTMKGPRLIAKEPTCNQWVQQGIRDYVYKQVSSTWVGKCITFRDQDPSRWMALLGSYYGNFATIDLKSASDRVSCTLVERIFRGNPGLLGAMIACRTRYIQPSSRLDKKAPQLLKLRKFSTQGSALTFPVQSLVFLAVCLGVGRHLEPRSKFDDLCRQVHVFGDDLIVPNHWEPLVREVLTSLHLRVNHTKTHTGGNFRESCGMDAFRGYDVTPPYVLSSPVESDPASIASGISVSNNFFKKGYWNAARWLEQSMPQGILKKMPVVGMLSGLFALQSFVGDKIPQGVKTRWNDALHRHEIKVLSIIAVAKRRKTNTVSNLLQFFTEEPPPWINYESGVVEAGVPLIRHAWVDVSGFTE